MIRIVIQNDGTGSEEVGNYDCTLSLPGEPTVVVWIEGFLREQGWEALVSRAVSRFATRLEER